MQTQIPAQQAQQNQSRAEHKFHESTQPQFEDARPEATAQLRLQSLMANSVRATQLKSTRAMMAASTPARNLGQSPGATNSIPMQRMEDEEPLQEKADEPLQREQTAAPAADPTPQDAPPTESPKPNSTGLPDNLKAGIENLSGMSMDHVKVHYNSDKPAQLQAHAYAQGSEIHVAPGQEKHLPHEAWHVVQQAQGRVRPTVQMKGGVGVNDDAGLECEADVMGERALASNGLLGIAEMPNNWSPSIQLKRERVTKDKKSWIWSDSLDASWYGHVIPVHSCHTSNVGANQLVGGFTIIDSDGVHSASRVFGPYSPTTGKAKSGHVERLFWGEAESDMLEGMEDDDTFNDEALIVVEINQWYTPCSGMQGCTNFLTDIVNQLTKVYDEVSACGRFQAKELYESGPSEMYPKHPKPGKIKPLNDDDVEMESGYIVHTFPPPLYK